MTCSLLQLLHKSVFHHVCTSQLVARERHAMTLGSTSTTDLWNPKKHLTPPATAFLDNIKLFHTYTDVLEVGLGACPTKKILMEKKHWYIVPVECNYQLAPVSFSKCSTLQCLHSLHQPQQLHVMIGAREVSIHHHPSTWESARACGWAIYITWICPFYFSQLWNPQQTLFSCLSMCP